MLSLGIDIGTSGIRSAVVDQDGEVVSFARADHLPQPPDHIDAEAWWQATVTCLHNQMAQLAADGHSPGDIRHIAVDGTSGSLVLVDNDLKPVTRALMYNAVGFVAEAEQIAAVAPLSHIARGPGSALARALRLVHEDTESRATHLLHQADFVAARMLGHGGHSDVMNALKTGVEPESGTWPDWVSSLLPPGILPEAHAIGTRLGTLTLDLCDALGLNPHVTIHAGTTDSIAAFLAAAPAEDGIAVTSLGSTLAIKQLCKTRVDAPEFGLYSHRVGDVWLVGGASNTGGRVLRHYFSDDALLTLSHTIDPSRPTGLDYYPLLEPGERFPVNDPVLAPRVSPRPDDDALFLQGLLEGMARIEAECYRMIEAHGGGYPTRILSVGGGAQNPVFNEIRARALGIAPLTAERSEAAIGAAMIPSMRNAG